MPQQTGTKRDQAEAFRNNSGAEISFISMISALREVMPGLLDHKQPATKGPRAAEGTDAI
jgi:hypothetical protein